MYLQITDLLYAYIDPRKQHNFLFVLFSSLSYFTHDLLSISSIIHRASSAVCGLRPTASLMGIAQTPMSEYTLEVGLPIGSMGVLSMKVAATACEDEQFLCQKRNRQTKAAVSNLKVCLL